MQDMTVDKVWLTDTAVWIHTTDGKEACEKFADYQRLKFATPEQRTNFTVDKFGIRWEELDEDLSFEGFFHEKKSSPLYDLFTAHPELNAAAIARRLGISQKALQAAFIGYSGNNSNDRARVIGNFHCLSL